MAVARAEQTVISDFDEAVWEHVLQKPPNELFGGYRTGLALIRGRFLVLKSDFAILQLKDAAVADGHAKDVRGQVSEGRLAPADRLTVHDPVLLPDWRINEWEQGGLFQSVSEFGAEEHRQGLDVHQKVLLGSVPVASGSQSASGHYVVDVRMIAQVARPGMEHAHHRNPAADESWVQSQCLYSLGGGPKQEVVHRLLVAACQRPELIRERKGHQEMGDRQQQTLLVCQPLLGLVILTLGAVSILAGVIAVVGLLAWLTVIEVAAKTLRAALLDVVQSPQMRRGHPVAKFGPVLGAMVVEDVSEFDHHRSAMRRVMTCAPSCSALAVRWV
jgi:hypothetical protein